MSEKNIKRIGMLTGGGDCPGLNAVIRATVKTAISEFGMTVFGIKDGFEGLIRDGDCVYELTPAHVRGLLPRGGTILGTTNRGNPFSFPAQRNGRTVAVDKSRTVMNRFKALGLDALVVIGGDGSLSIAHQFAERGMPVVGVPKTIDNDLSATDYTFGFNTAVRTATEAIDKLHTTAESHHRAMVIEVMGRDAGWIALSAGLAGGADVILIPEIPYRAASICAKVRARAQAGCDFSIVVAAEGAKPLRGRSVYLDAKRKRLGGVGEKVAADITKHSGHETRVTVLGHLQRGGSPSAFDRILASRFGAAAARLAARGEFGRMVCLQGADIASVPIAEAIGKLKTVPPHGELVQTARDLGISFGD
jgi:6-phosphofructokinase 1